MSFFLQPKYIPLPFILLLCSISNRLRQAGFNMTLCCLYFRTTVVAAAAFLDAFQKVADMATNTRGEQMCPFLIQQKVPCVYVVGDIYGSLSLSFSLPSWKSCYYCQQADLLDICGIPPPSSESVNVCYINQKQ